MKRRQFLKQSLLAAPAIMLGGLSLTGCERKRNLSEIKGGIVGANSKTGHLLRNAQNLPAPSSTIKCKVLIVGGGIAGLSARRWLEKNGAQDVLMIEMDHQPGGNASYGKNEVSAYPWGAHYLPVPDLRNKELLDFLIATNSITGFDVQGLPVYNEYHLCQDPEERLFINGYWQEGLVPEAGVSAEEKIQIARFFKLIEQFKIAVGSDGKDAFAIPLDHSSQDEQFTALDKISFEQYLDEQDFTSPYLRWYLDYGCKDDYGANLKTTSAWAGIHYFASRKGKGSGVNSSALLTWPQGNGFLMEHLKQQATSNILSGHLAFRVDPNDAGVSVCCYDVKAEKTINIQAEKVLIAAPQFVTKHLLHGLSTPEKIAAAEDFHYAPWMIANITLSGLPQGKGMPLCWDNVIYGTASVGYVNANQQDLSDSHKKVLTFYLPLSSEDPVAERQKAFNKTYNDWLREIINELEFAHEGITNYIAHVDIWVWGHGMIAPRPGLIWGNERKVAATPIDNKIFFAHSDLSGISIFEEAFYQGIRAANEILAS
ncbi:FAD-dependent oxidoreductase [Taibaiella soli]|uniref:FAD-dependent oxidoreductase n=1 Tax=Taibaiella soli TaxID=1649169 RepID=A0A2W2BF04_9BACT|nr:FAD-dependent oxidoreductase [Taibaiella soli]PZF74849.1 FAD-dependent oxidoreductase [Taibaiella soli]